MKRLTMLLLILAFAMTAQAAPYRVDIEPKTHLPVDLYFTQAVGAPTTLSATCTVDCTTVTLSSATGFVDGSYVGIFSGSGRFYFGTQIGAPAGSVITLDTPLDFPFEAGDNVISTIRNMAVDGSSTPQVFQIGAPGTSIQINITRLHGYIESANSMDDGDFGGGAALTNGIFLRQVDGVTNNLWNAKTNGELALLCGGDFNYTDKPPGGSVYGARFRNSYSGPEKHDVILQLRPGDILELHVPDDVATGNDIFYLMAQGYVLE